MRSRVRELKQRYQMLLDCCNFDRGKQRIVMPIHKYNRSGGDMRMEGLRKHPIPKFLSIVKSERNQSFPEVLAVHLDERVERLLLGLKFHEDAKLPLEEIQNPVADHPVKTALLFYLFLDALLQLLHIEQPHEDQYL